MKLNNTTSKSLSLSIEELAKEFPFLNAGINLNLSESNTNSISLSTEDNSINIKYIKQNDIYYMLHIANSKSLKESYQLVLPDKSIDTLAFMVDCSRNNVLKVETIKQLIRYLAYMGYDELKLYMEDTYTIKSEPYFGYLRGRYTTDELKQIDDYANIFNIAVIPCIQTLAHFTTTNRWCVYNEYFDYDDILMVGEPKVYKLIDEMFSTLSKCFRSKKINIGMDEAYFLGRGKYLDKNGYEKRQDILQKHLNKVLKLCDKYNYEPEMWSDMFFTYSKQTYQVEDVSKLPKIDIPDNLKLVYWDYEIHDNDYIQKAFKLHKNITDNFSYAGGAWKWIGFAPNNEFSIEEFRRFLPVCSENKVKEVMVTAWGDNGGECSVFSIIPTLNYVGNSKYFGPSVTSDEYFKCLTGLSFNNFMYLDRVNQVGQDWSPLHKNYMSGTFLYNDPLLGIYDSTVRDDQSEIYKIVTKALKTNVSNNKFDYLFETSYKLTDVLINKSDLGLRLRKAYKSKNISELELISKELVLINIKIEDFYDSFSHQWHKESKANGFDIQDRRLGGLMLRIKHAHTLIEEYLKGEIDTIDELEENIIDFYGNCDEWTKPDDLCESSYKKICSVNVNK